METACITGMTGTQESSPAAMSALTITAFQPAITTAAKTGRKNKKGKEDGRQLRSAQLMIQSCAVNRSWIYHITNMVRLTRILEAEELMR